jgi:hypothetical protein
LEDTLKQALWQQFGASIDMLEQSLRACPDQLWQHRLWDDPELPRASEFWYIAFHAIFWLDLYLYGRVDGFTPPAPFTLDELDPAGIVPERPYGRDELLAYLEHACNKCLSMIESLSEERMRQICIFPWGEVTFLALLLDNMRHVQEHAAQLNMVLGQQTGWSPRWITNARQVTA